MPNGEGSSRDLRFAELLFLCAAISAGLALLHWRTVDMRDQAFQLEWHRAIVSGHGPYPEQYRILRFRIADLLMRAGLSLPWAYGLLRFSFTTASLLIFYRFLRAWFEPLHALLGFFMAAAILPFSYLYYGMQVTDPLNMLVFFLAAWAIRDGRDNWLFPLVAVGMLNRETVIL